MLSASAAARLESWARVRERVGDAAVAEISALRALGAGRVDVLSWRPVPGGRQQNADLPVHGIRLSLRFRQAGQVTFYNGAVEEPGHEPWRTGWSEDGAYALRDLARLALDVLAERRRQAA